MNSVLVVCVHGQPNDRIMDVQCETYKQTLFCPELGHGTLPIEYLGEALRNGAAACNQIRDQLAQFRLRGLVAHEWLTVLLRLQSAVRYSA